MFSYILKQIICNVFDTELERHQYRVENGGKCLLIRFDLSLNYDAKEMGKRWVDLLIYAPCNYVAVFIKEGKRVRVGSNLEQDEGSWKKLSYHDSGWREDGVDRFLFKYRERLSLLDFHLREKWYSIQDVPREIFNEKLWNKEVIKSNDCT